MQIGLNDIDEPPPAPGAPSLTLGNNPKTAIIVSWQAPDMTGKPAITGYDLQYRMKGATDWIDQPFSGTTTRDVVSGLTPETEYEARVRAANAEGTGEWSSPGSGKTADEDVPEKPDAPSVSASASHPKTRLNVSWSAPENEGPPIKTYMLRYREQGTDDDWSLRSTEETSDVLVRLSPGATYEVQVRATNAQGPRRLVGQRRRRHRRRPRRQG